MLEGRVRRCRSRRGTSDDGRRRPRGITLACTATMKIRRVSRAVLAPGEFRFKDCGNSSPIQWTAPVISRAASDARLRRGLHETGNVRLQRSTRPSQRSIWGRAWSERIGVRKSLVAVARKVAMLPLAMSRTGWVPVRTKALRQNDQHLKR